MSAPGSADDDGPSIDALPGLLDRLERHWALLEAPLATMAAPGLTDEQIDELMAPTGMHLTEELRIWFRWHNGHNSRHAQDVRSFVAGATWQLRGLAYCVELTLESNRSDPSGLRRRQTWFDFCERGGAKETLVVDLAAPALAQAPVFFTAMDFAVDEAVPVAGSLTQLVQLWVGRLDAGRPAVTWQNDDFVWHNESHGLLEQGRFG